MRPVRLHLEGFTSFPKLVEIDFDGLDLFAVTGATGAGKTSVLDAMLYALYGQTPRLGPNEIRRLVSLGGSTVKVMLEFRAGGGSYRVVRRAKVARTVVTEILLEQREGAEWEQVAGGVKEVGERLAAILGLDFTGFTRSVILPQGEFDRFLRGDPAQRTDILKDLLNLRIYERMMQSANATAKQLALERGLLEKQLADYGEATPAKMAAQQAQREERLQEQLRQVTEREKLAAMHPAALELRSAREEKQKLLGELAKERQAATAASLEACTQRLAALEEQLRQTGYVEADWVELTRALPLARQYRQLESERRTKAGDERLDAIECEQAFAAAQQAIEQFRSAHGSSDVLRGRLQDLKEALAAMEPLPGKAEVDAAVAQAEHAVEHLRERNAANEIRKRLAAGDSCPVCRQTVARVPAVEPQAQLEQARALLEEVRQEQAKWMKADSRLSEARRKARVAPEELQRLMGEWERLEREQQAAFARQQLAQTVADIDRKLLACRRELLAFPNWGLQPLDALAEASQKQEAARQVHQRLEREREQARTEREAALERGEKISGLELAVERQTARIQDLEPRVAGLPSGSEAAHIEAALRQIDRLIDELRAEVSRADVRIETLRQQMEAASRVEAAIEANRAEEAIQKQLGQLLAADEFIAFIQREALTRLAASASQRLMELSEQRYTLAVAERNNEFSVIDNWNAGETRSAKTLSGGESFLASLALALALSDGLAGFASETARARLDSLFIDEGISSLDPESLQTAIDALTALSGGTRMVGVISHIAELADKLPGRIRVEKAHGGSRVFVERNHSHSIVAGGL